MHYLHKYFQNYLQISKWRYSKEENKEFVQRIIQQNFFSIMLHGLAGIVLLFLAFLGAAVSFQVSLDISLLSVAVVGIWYSWYFYKRSLLTLQSLPLSIVLSLYLVFRYYALI